MTMAEQPVLIVSKPLPHIVLLEMNRPSQHNAVNADLHQAMFKAFDDYINDPDLWCLVIAGRGKSFSAGNDLKETNAAREKLKASGNIPQVQVASQTKTETETDEPGKSRDRGFGGWTMHPNLTKPVVAAVHGFALGGGLEMAMAADIVVASEDAKFGKMQRCCLVLQWNSELNSTFDLQECPKPASAWSPLPAPPKT